MLGSEGLDGKPQLYRRIPVGADKLVVLQLDNVALGICHGLGCTHQFARFIRQQHGHGEDPVALDQAVLYHGGHGDDIHISAA